MDKSLVRKEYRQKRDNFDKKVLVKADELIYNKTISLSEFEKARVVMTYVSMGSEVDTHKIIDYCFVNGKTVCVPVVVKGTRNLAVSYISSMDDLECGSYEILEPKKFIKCDISDIDVIIIPAIAFDENRHRVGYGAGFYDRLLANCNAFKLGVCYEFCIAPSAFPQQHDIKADMVITDERII